MASFVKVIEDDTDAKVASVHKNEQMPQDIEPDDQRLVTFACDPPPPTYVEVIE